MSASYRIQGADLYGLKQDLTAFFKKKNARSLECTFYSMLNKNGIDIEEK
jgi:hypothetical protein